MNRVLLLCLSAVAMTATGCAGYYGAPIMPPPGSLFAEISAPVDIDADNNTVGNKVGRASTSSILGLFATGDCSIKAAADDGGISRIDHVDYEFKNLLGIVSNFTIVVYGE